MCSEAGAGGLKALAAVVERFVASEHAEDPVELGKELVELRRLCNRLELAFAKRTYAFGQTDLWDEQGFASHWHWIRSECNMSANMAGGASAVGRHIDELPESIEAMRKGEIGFSHLTLMAQTAQAVEDAAGDVQFDEKPLLRLAKEHFVNRFRKDCTHVRHAADQHAFLLQQEEQVDARELNLSPLENGCLEIYGFLDVEGGSLLRTALEPLARRNSATDTRLRKRRLADALVELAGHGLDAGTLPTTAGQRPHLQVTCSLETLQGLPGASAGELEWGGTIAAATVQRLACDAAITRVVLDSRSQVIDVGRSRRVPSTGQRRALRARDGGCVWPRCDRPASWTSAHHVAHWVRDHGNTDLPNLVLLCGAHHRLAHEGGWEVVRSADGRVVAVPPIAFPLARARAPDAVAVG
jgi:Domain of unknown function (DUF222)